MNTSIGRALQCYGVFIIRGSFSVHSLNLSNLEGLLYSPFIQEDKGVLAILYQSIALRGSHFVHQRKVVIAFTNLITKNNKINIYSFIVLMRFSSAINSKLVCNRLYILITSINKPDSMVTTIQGFGRFTRRKDRYRDNFSLFRFLV